MTLAQLVASIERDSAPPASLSKTLRALWYDAAGSWEQAHETAQDVATVDGSWVHAYLHRKEGDLGNAGYWYRRAGQQEHRGSLEDEWTEIATALLGKDTE